MPTKGLLDLDDDLLRLIGFFLSHNGIGDKPVPLPVESPIRPLIYPNHLLPFTATCQRIRSVVPLSGLAFQFWVFDTKRSKDNFATQAWVKQIPPRISSGIG